jgi:S-adenosylhomocysteine hydrolase
MQSWGSSDLPQVMDVSFAGQTLMLGWLANGGAARPRVSMPPAEIDQEVAR